MNVVDRRDRRRRDDGYEGEIPGDTGNWLSSSAGNRIGRIVGTPATQEGKGGEDFGRILVERVFG